LHGWRGDVIRSGSVYPEQSFEDELTTVQKSSAVNYSKALSFLSNYFTHCMKTAAVGYLCEVREPGLVSSLNRPYLLTGDTNSPLLCSARLLLSKENTRPNCR